MAKEFDIEKFNNDPAFEKDRNQFDLMFAGALARAALKAKKDEPESESIFDALFGKKDEVNNGK